MDEPKKQPTADELVTDPKYAAQKDLMFSYFDKYVEVRNAEAKAKKPAERNLLDIIFDPSSIFGDIK